MSLPKKQMVYTVEEIASRWRKDGFTQPWEPDAPWVKGTTVSSTQILPHHHRNTYVRDLQPLFNALRVLGILSYRITSTGEVHKVPVVSFFTLYALLIQAGTMTIAVFCYLERIPLVGKPGTPFLNRIMDLGVMIIFSASCITPITLWIEQKNLVKFFAQWEYFQARYTKVTGKPLHLELRRKSFILMTFILVAAAMVAVDGFLLGEKSLTSVWQGIAFAYSALLGFLLPAIWYMTCTAFVKYAKSLASYLDQCYQQHKKLNDLRHLWRLLSSLTREMGPAMGLSCGTLTLIYLSAHTLTVYATLYVLLQDNPPVILIAVFATATAVFTGLLYLQCDAAGRATDQVGEQFQHRLEEFALAQPRTNLLLEEEISLFLQSMQCSPPVMTYSGFAEVNQHLMTSIDPLDDTNLGMWSPKFVTEVDRNNQNKLINMNSRSSVK